jgi:aspartate carbamoyltransferase catalytic subunit
MSAEEILTVLKHAESFKEVSTRRIKKVPTLRGRTIIHLFLEPSTRTRTSFEIAAKRLSGDIINISNTGSSMVKGETLSDTARNLQAMNPDVIVIRHRASGAAEIISQLVECSVINAGDGCNEHPTQALLDVMTIMEKKGRVAGLKVVIIGDILHSRVARSNIYALTTLGAGVHICAPGSMIPVGIEEFGVKVHLSVEEAVQDADVIMLLRIQLERESSLLIPSTREYARRFGLNKEKIRNAKKDVIIMHPGPINRGVEISHDLADGPSSVILDQVANGVASRMAALYLVAGVGREKLVSS